MGGEDLDIEASIIRVRVADGKGSIVRWVRKNRISRLSEHKGHIRSSKSIRSA